MLRRQDGEIFLTPKTASYPLLPSDVLCPPVWETIRMIVFHGYGRYLMFTGFGLLSSVWHGSVIKIPKISQQQVQFESRELSDMNKLRMSEDWFRHGFCSDPPAVVVMLRS